MNLRRQKTEIVFSLLTFLKCKKNSATRDPVQLGTPTVDGNYYKLDYGEAFYGAVYEMKYVGV